LDTDDLDRLGTANESISPYYLGCYPANVLPSNIRKHCCWIWNVDESDKSGTHWAAIAKRNDHITFFDSYGKTPEFFKRTYWIAYFQQKLKCKVSYYSQMQRQSYIRRTCGAWCLMFLWEFWSRDKNVLRTLNNGTNLLKNEQPLQTFVYEHFPGIKKIYEKKCRKCKGQMCKTFLDMYADRL
jgi:hypothetical protein